METLLRFNQEIEIRKGEDERIRHFIISTSRRDSHGTVIPVENWNIDDYNRSGAFYYQHSTWSSNPDMALGIGSAIKTSKALEGIGKFEPSDINELAEKILRKVDFGTLKSTSVGFLPTAKGHWGNERDGEDPESYYFGEVRLLEWSIVNIPSNADAIKKSHEAYDKFMLKEVNDHKSEGFKRDYNLMIRRMKWAI